VDAVAIIMMGGGAWLLFSAWKNRAPLTTLVSILSTKGYTHGTPTESAA
jgi:hypothetical protein